MYDKKQNVYILREADVARIESVLSTLRVALSTIITARTIEPSEHAPRNRDVESMEHLVDNILWEYGPDTSGLLDVF